jgi:cytochrome c peroxidase
MNILSWQQLFLVIFSVIAGNFTKADIISPAQQQSLAPGYESLQFATPEPGTYRLPILGKAADGKVLDTEGNVISLHRLMGDKVVLLSFIYSTCNDVNGCPLATAVFHKIKSRLKKEPELAAKLRLLTLSFNPEHDTPETMKQYGSGFQEGDVEWRFLTTRSEQELRPILEHYQQNIQKVVDAQGHNTDTFSHVLRVYLIDQSKHLRNIYSVSFLYPDTLINDIKTVLLAEPKKPAANSANAIFYSAGDNKSHYEDSDYETQSIALTDRTGRQTDLLKTIQKPPLGLPAAPVASTNPITNEKINLGRKLFYDRRLSLNNTFSCAMCHIPEQGFTSNERATAVGIEGRTVRRNAPTLYNVAYFKTLFHDSRETILEQQIWSPLLAPNEMANPSIGYVIEKIKNTHEYNKLFKKAFGKEPGMETIGMAIASYERTLISANSAFDRWYYAKDKKALDDKAQHGFQLFNGKANCSSCHTVTSHYAVFTDNNLHNTGIGYAEAMGKTTGKTGNSQRVQIAPGVFIDVETRLINTVSETKTNDLGRYEVTQNPQDRWKYKTPSLRNINLTAPYMHNGLFETLQQIVEFYNRGGIANENLDPLIKPLNLTALEINDLIAFLKALTGDNVKELVSDAFAAPIGDAE